MQYLRPRRREDVVVVAAADREDLGNVVDIIAGREGDVDAARSSSPASIYSRSVQVSLRLR